nr:C-type mannose receptor 2-like isoform X3 [Syngnathus scovelli]
MGVPNGWLGAWHHCVSEGGNLVSIPSSAEENFVKTTMAKYDRFWLGLSNQKCDKVWCRFEGGSQNLTWSDGQTTTYRNWAPNQLESADVASCAYVNQNVYHNSGKWWSGSCASSFAYMCKRPLDCPTCPVKSGPAVVKTSDCDNGEVLYGDHCYFFGPTHKTQEDGEDFCLARGAHLPRIHSKQDARFLIGHGSQRSNAPWLELKKNGKDYKWSDGTALDYDNIQYYTYSGECAYVWNEVIYLNYRCGYKQSVICQTAKRGGGRPQLPPLVGQPDWTDKCGWWLDQPSSDFCYLIIPQPTKTWQEAQDHCKAHEGNLLSIADSHEQDIVHVLVKSQAQASSLWLGADVSLDDDDGKWIDGSSFTYKRQTDGEAKGANCLSLPTGSDNWKYDPCGNKRGYVCKKRGKGVKESLPSLDTTKCPPGWLEHDSSCYKKEVKPNGWVGAWHHCVWLGGNLLSITSSAEEDFVKGTMDKDTPFWLGLSNQKCDDSWCRFEGGSQKLAWSDGQTTPHRNWAPNQLESADVASCAYVNQGGIGAPGKWRSGSCHSSLAYMCKRPQSCPEKQTCSPKHGPAVVTTAYCDDNAFHDDDYCYRYVKTHENYDDAEKFCQARGGHLASVHSKQEAQFVYDHSQTSQSALVGLKKTTGGDYEWSDGTTFGYKEWEKNTKGDCAFPNSVGELSGCQCSTARPFFCKTAKRGGTRRLPSSVSLVSWTDKCGWWLDNPTNDFCYQMISQPTKTWQKAQDHCKRLEGDLLSITDSHEQGFIESIAKIMMGDDASLWLGANGGIEGDGSKWADGSPFSYLHSSAGDAKGGKCLSLLTGSSDWKRDKCDNMKGYVCKKRGKGVKESLPSLDATKCPPGWLEHDSSCYKKEVKPNGWVGAWHHCVWLGGNLLSITSSAEEDFVKGTMDEDTPFWLGLSNQKCDDSWCRFEGGSQKLAWSDDQTTPHRNWAPNQLESADVASCAYVNQGGIGAPGKWRSGSCHSSLAYMCKRPRSCPEKQTCSPKHGPAVVTTAYCDDNAFHDDDYCYRYVKTHENYDDAEKFCQARGGHLASVHSKQEAQFVYDHSQTSQSALVGLKKTTGGDYEWSDGTTFGYKEWEKNTKGDCAFPNSVGELSGCQCSTARPFFCKTAKRRGTRRLPSSVSLVSWTDKCGWWLDNPTNDFCYQMISQPTKTWQKAQDHCKRLEGDLLSITDSYEQGFIESIAKIMMGNDASLWLGANGGIEGDGSKWADGSPFSYRHLSAGDAKGGKCLSLLTGSSDWKRDKCDNMKGYVCKKRGKGKKAKPQLLHDSYKKEFFCQDDWKVLTCSDERVIRVQSAFLGRRRSDVCLSSGTKSEDRCRMKGALSHFRALCDKHQHCPIQPTGTDPCPGVSKYHHIVYSCEEKVCLDRLGIAGGTIPDSSFSASSYEINGEPHKARLGGSGCWIPAKILGSWIQVNLGQRFKVTGIVTQRCMYQEYSFSKFELEFSTDGKTWYRHPEQPVVGTHMLTRFVFAQYVRLLPRFFGLRFDVLGCTPDDTSRDILCSSTATSLGLDGSMTVRCPPGCAQTYTVYGTYIYKQDSNICAAAIHSGVIENVIGGIVTLLQTDPQKAYNNSDRNGITSSGGDALAQSPSYTFVEQEPRCLGPEWEEFADFCYKRFDERKTWDGAQQACSCLNAKLVSIRSKVERDWLQDLLTSAPGDTWIGLNAPVAPGKFAWSDRQKVTLTNWAPEELADRLENCVVASSQSGKWKMMSCVQLNGYMCKMPTERYALDKKGANASGK